jgi:hypothetical protein
MFLESALPLLMHHLPRVATLFLDGMIWRRHSSLSRSMLLDAFPLNEYLAVTQSTFTSFHALSSLISSFPRLRWLYCNTVSVDESGAEQGMIPERVNPAPPASLFEVVLGCEAMPQLLTWLTDAGAPPISVVELMDLPPGRLQPLAIFLRAQASNIQEVHLSLSSDTGSLPFVRKQKRH